MGGAHQSSKTVPLTWHFLEDSTVELFRGWLIQVGHQVAAGDPALVYVMFFILLNFYDQKVRLDYYGLGFVLWWFISFEEFESLFCRCFSTDQRV
ncbi:hypothetical protein Dimus_017576 [Dionaea muscipula]